MQALIESVEKLCGAVLAAEPDDLQALADAHAKVEAACAAASAAAGDLPAGVLGAVQSSAGQARTALEKLILHEVDDAAAQLASVNRTVAELQKLIQAAASGEPVTLPVPGPAPAPSTGQPVAVPVVEALPPAAAFNADDAPLIREFVAEATSHIESAEQEVLKVEEDPGDADAISALFRAFHTIKGVAGFLNLNQVQGLAHSAESLLDQAREGKIQLTGTASDLVLQSIDLMKQLIVALDAATAREQPMPPDPAVPGLVRRLDAFVAGGEAPAPWPSASKPAATTAAPVEPDPGTRAAPEPPARPGPREPADHHEPNAASQSASDPAHAGRPAAPGQAPANGDHTIKVATDRLDSLINMVGELVIAQSMVAQDVSLLTKENQRLGRNMGHLGKITRELQDLSMSLRMVPIDAVFRKMPRLVRDVARKLGKDVDLEIVGRDTEVDRNVVESLGDPLVHMVRNSVDHGIETPDDRVAAGKSRNGKVTLRAYHQAGNINIEISDDGKGLNKARILKKAVEAGIVHDGQSLTDQEIFRLIFHAGLSTADKVTDVSGRGVGMDVVKQNIEKLRGRIEIASVEGKGSTFTIRLPLTLAVIDGLIVRVGREKYVLPILSIEQSLRPRPEQLSTVQGRGEQVMVRGAMLPLVRLHRLYGVTPQTDDPTQALVVIVQDNDRRACLLVDELLRQEQVVIKSLGDGLDKQPGISGGAVLGDGNVSLILDVPGILDLYGQN